MQPGCSPSPMVIRRDDHQPCGGEKQAGLRPLPRPQLQGCSSSMLGRRVRRVGARLRVGSGPLLPLVFGGEGHPPALRRKHPPAMRRKANCCCLARVQLSVLHLGDGHAVRRWLLSLVLKWWSPLVRLPTATVASADETITATCARGLRLFGFNGWFSSPMRGCERGPFSSSVCPEAIVAAVLPPETEVVVVLLVQWSSASHLELVILQAFWCGGCSFLREWTRSLVCNGTLLRARCNSFKY
jgi:hypothetical protein